MIRTSTVLLKALCNLWESTLVGLTSEINCLLQGIKTALETMIEYISKITILL